jgi:predicted component of type VI protein secretion system
MTEQELIDYFTDKDLPESLRINRAVTQHDVRAAVDRNIETMLDNPTTNGAKHRLTQIKNALETPYDGPVAIFT